MMSSNTVLVTRGLSADIRGIEHLTWVTWFTFALLVGLDPGSIGRSPTYVSLLAVPWPPPSWSAIGALLGLAQIWVLIVQQRPGWPLAAFCRRHDCRAWAMAFNAGVFTLLLLLVVAHRVVIPVIMGHPVTVPFAAFPLPGAVVGCLWTIRDMRRRHR